MKDYKIGVIFCRCSNLMRLGKLVKIHQYTSERKKCPNCGRMRNLYIRKKKEKKTQLFEEKPSLFKRFVKRLSFIFIFFLTLQRFFAII